MTHGFEHIFSARHGRYQSVFEEDGSYVDHLTDSGRNDIIKLGGLIKEICPGEKIIVCAGSPENAVLRVRESGELLAGVFNMRSEDILYTKFLVDERMDAGLSFEEYCEQILDLGDERWSRAIPENTRGAKGLVLVSHYGIADIFAEKYIQRNWGSTEEICGIETAQAIHVDEVNRKWGYLPGKD